MTDVDQGTPTPLVEGGCDVVGGVPVGAWLVDRLGTCWGYSTPLDRGRALRVHRDGGALIARISFFEASPDALPPSGDAGDVVSVQRLLKVLDGFAHMAAEGFASLNPRVTSQALTAIAQDPATGDAALRSRLAAEVRAALDAMEPLLATLDPRARRLALADEARDDDMRIYARLDRTMGDAVLADAWEMAPMLRHRCARVFAWDREDARRALAGGTDALTRFLLDDVVRFAKRKEARKASILWAMGALTALPGKNLRSMGPDLDLGSDEDLAVQVGILLEPYPVAWRPGDAASWAAFAACGPALAYAGHRAPSGHAATMANAGGDWAGLGRRLTEAHGLGPGVYRLRQAMRDMEDMYGVHADQVLVPAMAATGEVRPYEFHARRVARNLIESGRGMRRILEVSRRWHGEAARMRARLPRPRPGAAMQIPTAWPMAWPSARYGDVALVELTDRRALDAEGSPDLDQDGVRGLHHCVGGYGGQCLDGTSRILSVRDVSGDGIVRLSTVQVTWDAVKQAARIVQHRAWRNGPPCGAALDAVRAYLDDVVVGGIAVDAGALAPVPRPDMIASAAGYDWRDREARAGRPCHVGAVPARARCAACPRPRSSRATTRRPGSSSRRAPGGHRGACSTNLPTGERRPWEANAAYVFSW